MNMKEIAKMANVSVATVSYALNGTGNVSEKKKKEILEIVRREGYSPNRIAKSLRTKKSNTIGVMVEDVTSFQTPRIINGINNLVEQMGYAVILYDMGLLKKTGNNFSQVEYYRDALKKSMQLFEKTQIDGMIYVAMHDRDVSEFMPKTDIPMVLVYCYDTKKEHYYVTYDNREISESVVGYLYDSGHSRLGVICGPTSSLPARRRYEGFCRELEKYHISLDPSYVFKGNWEFEDGVKAYKAYRRLRKKPTAVFAMNDLMAVGFMDAALNDGIMIPEDISVVGFDNRQECRFTRPRLTTIDIPLENMGKEAGKLLMRLIDGKEVEGKRIVLPCSLMEKNSVKRLCVEV